MKKIMIDKEKFTGEKLKEFKSIYETVRDDNKNLVIMVEDDKDISEFNGLFEMNE